MQALLYCRDSAARKIIQFPHMITSGTDPAPESPRHDPQRHGNWAQIITCGIAGLALVVAALSFFSNRKSQNTQRDKEDFATRVDALIGPKLQSTIKDLNTSVDNKLNPINSKIDTLLQQVGKLQGQIEQLNADQKRLTKLQLDKLSAQIATARRTKTEIGGETLARLGENLLTFVNSDDKQISDVAWRTTTQLADYRTLLNQEAAAPLLREARAPVPIPYFHFNWSFKILSTTVESGVGILYDARKLVPFANVARYEEINDPNQSQQPGPEFLIVYGQGAELLLDGHRLKNVVIHDLQVRYDGGPLIMENVYFVNCKFVITKKPSVQQFVQNVITSVPSSFRAG